MGALTNKLILIRPVMGFKKHKYNIISEPIFPR